MPSGFLALDATVIAAIIGGVFAVVAAIITVIFARRGNDQQSDNVRSTARTRKAAVQIGFKIILWAMLTKGCIDSKIPRESLPQLRAFESDIQAHLTALGVAREFPPSPFPDAHRLPHLFQEYDPLIKVALENLERDHMNLYLFGFLLGTLWVYLFVYAKGTGQVDPKIMRQLSDNAEKEARAANVKSHVISELRKVRASLEHRLTKDKAETADKKYIDLIVNMEFSR
jgi:hypothetical protein